MQPKLSGQPMMKSTDSVVDDVILVDDASKDDTIVVAREIGIQHISKAREKQGIMVETRNPAI